ncbi:MAG: hypothetical protein GXY43_04425 [Clostridiaceae bacterium]|nr:hypothetical protein [Clostridiaceae bacterium]
MKSFFTLIKVNFLNFLGSMQKAKKGRYIVSALMILAFIVFFGGSMSMQAVATAFLLVVEYNLPQLAVFMGLSTAFAISILFGMMRATTATTSKDAELLLSMPIRKSIVVLSKITTQFLLDAPILIIMLLPTIIATFAFGGLDAAGLARGVFISLLLPTLAMTISMVIGALFSMIRERIPGGRIIVSIFAMTLLMGYIFWNMQSNGAYRGFAEMGSEQAKQIIEAFWPIKVMTYFITEGRLLNTIFALLLIFLPFALTVAVYAARYGRGSYQKKGRNRKLSFRSRTMFASLLSVELKKYVSSTLYVINTSFGVVMMVVVTTVFLVMGPDVIEKIMFAGEEMPFVISTENYAAIATLIFLFFAAMTATTPASISFEGKRLWILRSMPVRAFEVLRAKLMLNVLLFVPAQIICSAAVMIRLGVHPGPGIAMVLLPAGTNLVVAGGGLILNLLMPKLDWRNEAQVLKQSISVLLTMLIGFGLASLPIIIYFVFFFSSGDGTVAMTVTAYSITLLYAVLFTVELLILAFPGKRMFERLSA